jgi:mannose-6-phosphate isomerase-like protein (cupin superfamily)
MDGAEQSGEIRVHGGLIREAVRWHQADAEPRSLGLSAYLIRAGERCTAHVHQGKVETWFFMSGRAEVSWGEQLLIVGAGDAVRTPPGIAHGVRALGDEPVRFLNIVEYIAGAEVKTVELEEPGIEEPA